MFNCNSESDIKTESIFNNFFVGSWIQDSTSFSKKNSEIEYFPTINCIEINSDSSITYHTFNQKSKKLRSNNYDNLSFTDSTMKDNLPLKENERQPNWGKYELEIINSNSFKLIALYETTNWTFPEEDSIIYYTRVSKVNNLLDSLKKIEKEKINTVLEIDSTYLMGYWKWDSTEYLSYKLSFTDNYFLYIDSSFIYHTLWIGKDQYIKRSDSINKNSTLFYEDGLAKIKRLNKEILALEEIDETRVYTKINPDSVIPLEMRIDLK